MVSRRLAVVSNRLPIVLQRDEQGKATICPGSGGLVTALGPVLRDRGGIWIGWMGAAEEEFSGEESLANLLSNSGLDIGYELESVGLSTHEIASYYYGFSNAILWPLFHDLLSKCRFEPSYWTAYQEVNAKFASRIAAVTTEDDFVWVHDYHLFLVAAHLKRSGVKRATGFFLHTPFPPLDIFLRLPWRYSILESLLDYDLIGFQTLRDRRNFFECMQALFPKTRVKGRGQVAAIVVRSREIRAGIFPIGIDFQEFARCADSAEVAETAWYIHEKLPNRKIMLGVDRLDYTKGIPERLRAFANALERYPELRGRVSLVLVTVPSRRKVEEYESLKQEIEQLVGQINGQFSEVGWIAVHYIFRPMERNELIAYYRTSEIALITPLKDGMNLVAKEYCASSSEERGVVILSEFAGAAAQFRDAALLINPHDIEGMADAIRAAVVMEEEERRSRMRRLRQNVQRHDIFRWVDSFLRAAIARNLSDFPLAESYVPSRSENTEPAGR